jgi:type II secretory pathway component PulF
MFDEHKRLAFAFGVVQRRDFYDDMRRFVEAGLAPFSVIEKMIQVYRGRRRLRWKVKLLTRVATRMREGKAFSEALARYIPPEEAALLEAGEKTGTFIEALRKLAYLCEKRREAKAAMIKNLVPPAIIVAAATTILYFILKMIITQAIPLIPPQKLTRLMIAPVYIGVGTYLMENGLMILMGVLAVIITIAMRLPRGTPTGIRAKLDDWMPPWSLYRRLQSAFVMTTASAMLAAGMPFQMAVATMRRNARGWLGVHLRRVEQGLAEGRTEIDALLRSKMLPDDAADRLSIYSLVPNFHQVMERIASESIEALVARVIAISNVLDILVKIGVGVFILSTLFTFGEIGIAIDPKAMRESALSQ